MTGESGGTGAAGPIRRRRHLSDGGRQTLVAPLANRPRAVGNTTADIARFRDEALLELLKRHGRLPSGGDA
jgi:hypothetical protein